MNLIRDPFVASTLPLSSLSPLELLFRVSRLFLVAVVASCAYTKIPVEFVLQLLLFGKGRVYVLEIAFSQLRGFAERERFVSLMDRYQVS